MIFVGAHNALGSLANEEAEQVKESNLSITFGDKSKFVRLHILSYIALGCPVVIYYMSASTVLLTQPLSSYQPCNTTSSPPIS